MTAIIAPDRWRARFARLPRRPGATLSVRHTIVPTQATFVERFVDGRLTDVSVRPAPADLELHYASEDVFRASLGPATDGTAVARGLRAAVPGIDPLPLPPVGDLHRPERAPLAPLRRVTATALLVFSDGPFGDVRATHRVVDGRVDAVEWGRAGRPDCRLTMPFVAYLGLRCGAIAPHDLPAYGATFRGPLARVSAVVGVLAGEASRRIRAATRPLDEALLRFAEIRRGGARRDAAACGGPVVTPAAGRRRLPNALHADVAGGNRP